MPFKRTTITRSSASSGPVSSIVKWNDCRRASHEPQRFAQTNPRVCFSSLPAQIRYEIWKYHLLTFPGIETNRDLPDDPTFPRRDKLYVNVKLFTRVNQSRRLPSIAHRRLTDLFVLSFQSYNDFFDILYRRSVIVFDHWRPQEDPNLGLSTVTDHGCLPVGRSVNEQAQGIVVKRFHGIPHRMVLNDDREIATRAGILASINHVLVLSKNDQVASHEGPNYLNHLLSTFPNLSSLTQEGLSIGLSTPDEPPTQLLDDAIYINGRTNIYGQSRTSLRLSDPRSDGQRTYSWDTVHVKLLRGDSSGDLTDEWGTVLERIALKMKPNGCWVRLHKTPENWRKRRGEWYPVKEYFENVTDEAAECGMRYFEAKYSADAAAMDTTAANTTAVYYSDAETQTAEEVADATGSTEVWTEDHVPNWSPPRPDGVMYVMASTQME